MAIFVSANRQFSAIVTTFFWAKTRDVEMAVESTISFEIGWGKLL
jgi:hypothetical protein